MPEDLYLPLAGTPLPDAALDLSPLQAALYAAALTNGGERPSPLLVTAVNTPAAGWVLLTSSQATVSVYPPSEATAIVSDLKIADLPIWGTGSTAMNSSEKMVTWYVGGTAPDWNGTPLSIAVLLEEEDAGLAEMIGLGLLGEAMLP